MPETIRVGLVGDFNAAVRAHQMIPQALAHSAVAAGLQVEPTWLPTQTITSNLDRLASFHALWCVPASPYGDMDGALAAIHYARTRACPYLGTCGGFQHAVIEYARNVLGYADADHEETNPDGTRLFIRALSCSMVGKTGIILLQPGSRAAAIYGKPQTTERFHCNFGVASAWQQALDKGGLKITGIDPEGSARIVELAAHAFFLATLFQPELSSTPAQPHPIISAFVAVAAQGC
jgi:CTP synthase (UTP-ammonia lyase)